MKGHILYCTEWPKDRTDVVVQCGRTVKAARAVMKADYAAPISEIEYHEYFNWRDVCRACRNVAVPLGKHGKRYEAIMVSGEDYMTLESKRAELPVVERT